jgi:hypothetical protein
MQYQLCKCRLSCCDETGYFKSAEVRTLKEYVQYVTICSYNEQLQHTAYKCVWSLTAKESLELKNAFYSLQM